MKLKLITGELDGIYWEVLRGQSWKAVEEDLFMLSNNRLRLPASIRSYIEKEKCNYFKPERGRFGGSDRVLARIGFYKLDKSPKMLGFRKYYQGQSLNLFYFANFCGCRRSLHRGQETNLEFTFDKTTRTLIFEIPLSLRKKDDLS